MADVDSALENPIDFEGSIGANFRNAMANITFGRAPRPSEFLENQHNDANRVNLLKKRATFRKLIPKLKSTLFEKRDKGVKTGWRNRNKISECGFGRR